MCVCVYLIGQTKSILVSPFRIIRMKLTKEDRANYMYIYIYIYIYIYMCVCVCVCL